LQMLEVRLPALSATTASEPMTVAGARGFVGRHIALGLEGTRSSPISAARPPTSVDGVRGESCETMGDGQ
jgi:hypothetical protein